MYYFAYASNLNRQQMQSRCPGCRPLFTAVLPNFKLVFTGWSRQWHGGTATLKSLTGEKVRGAVYEVDDASLRKLDKAEGVPQGVYTRFNVTVFDEDNQPHQAVTYIKPGRLEETLPSQEYGAVVRRGYLDWRII